MSFVRLARGAMHPLLLATILCACPVSLATITFSSNTLTYSSPSDLGATIDPSGQKEVAVSYGLTKAAFQALSPRSSPSTAPRQSARSCGLS